MDKPEGTITYDRFVEMVEESQTTDVMFYRASKKFGFTESIKLYKASIRISEHTHTPFCYYPRKNRDEEFFSLKDAHLIEQNYNDWFSFENQALAFAYAESEKEIFYG